VPGEPHWKHTGCGLGRHALEAGKALQRDYPFYGLGTPYRPEDTL
jgi:hypothetical protein